MHFFAMLLAKLSDLIMIMMALVAGGLCQKRWHIIVAAAFVAGIAEIFLFSIFRTIDPISFPLGFVAAAVWASLAFGIMRYKASRKLRDS